MEFISGLRALSDLYVDVTTKSKMLERAAKETGFRVDEVTSPKNTSGAI
jgi:hypothetical protein